MYVNSDSSNVQCMLTVYVNSVSSNSCSYMFPAVDGLLHPQQFHGDVQCMLTVVVLMFSVC